MSLRWASCAALVALPLAAQAGERFEPEDGSAILERWRKETNGSRWLKQGPGLFRAIGFVAEPR